MIMRLVLALALLFTPLSVYGEENIPESPVQYVKIALWARYCELNQKSKREYCTWTYITDNLIAQDKVGPMWTTEIACVMQAQVFFPQFLEANPSYRKGYFESWRCFSNGKRPPLDV